MAETEKELMLRVADEIDQRGISNTGPIGQDDFGVWVSVSCLAEARTISRVLREAAEGPKVKPMAWANDGTIWWCNDKITGQRYGARTDAMKASEEKRRASIILSALAPPPPATETTHSQEPRHD